MSTLRTDTLSNSAGSASVPVNTVVNGSAKAWVNFNGTTTPPTVRASFNVSSVTRNGTGDYTLNFTNALADANYSVSSGVSFSETTSGGIFAEVNGTNNQLTASIRISTRSGTAFFDATGTYVAIFR